MDTIKLYRAVPEPYAKVVSGVGDEFMHEALFYDFRCIVFTETMACMENSLSDIICEKGKYFFVTPEDAFYNIPSLIWQTCRTFYPFTYRILEYEMRFDDATKLIGYGQYGDSCASVEVFVPKTSIPLDEIKCDNKKLCERLNRTQDEINDSLLKFENPIRKNFMRFDTMDFNTMRRTFNRAISNVKRDVMFSTIITGKSWRVISFGCTEDYRVIYNQVDTLKEEGFPLGKIDRQLFKELNASVCGSDWTKYDLVDRAYLYSDRNKPACANPIEAKSLIKQMQPYLNVKS